MKWCEYVIVLHVYLCQAETQRLKKEALEKGKELQAQQTPLLGLRSQRTTLESEKREKEGTSYTRMYNAALLHHKIAVYKRFWGLASVEVWCLWCKGCDRCKTHSAPGWWVFSSKLFFFREFQRM